MRTPLVAALTVMTVIGTEDARPIAAQDNSMATGPVTSPATWSGRSTVYAPRDVAATSQPLATTAALEIMQNGGNAIDAAVAAAAVLNVVEPHMTGMGGDMFAILWSAEEGRLVGLDASGRSGSRMTPESVADARERDENNVHTVTVPGALSGWSTLVETYGDLTLAEVLAPAIRIAEGGFPVSPIIAHDWQAAEERLGRDPGAAATYLVDGKAPEAGDWFRNADLARSFSRIAEEGPGVLYGGALGRELVQGLDALGGFITLEDLSRHEPRWVEPMSVDYKGYTLWELPPAGQGIAALQMLKMLEGHDFSSMTHNSAEYLHLLIEAKKLAYADLARYVADADHMDVDPASLLDPSYLAGRAALIDPERAAERVDPGRMVTDSETIYLTVADRHGNMISFINSIYSSFGSGVVVPGTGFALEEGHPNRVAPGKRPFHTIIPAFVTRDGQPWVSFGVMGGAMQPQGHVQVLLNLVEFGMDPQEAIDAGRFRHYNGTRVAIESLDPEVGEELTSMGHELLERGGGAFGGGQLILRLDQGWAAASDPRKDGMAAGR